VIDEVKRRFVSTATLVDDAAKLAAKGNKGYAAPPIYIGNGFAGNLNEHNMGLLTKDWANGCYTANAINLVMEDWYQNNCT